MLYFCTENEKNPFFFENRPVGFYMECLLTFNFSSLKAVIIIVITITIIVIIIIIVVADFIQSRN